MVIALVAGCNNAPVLQPTATSAQTPTGRATFATLTTAPSRTPLPSITPVPGSGASAVSNGAASSPVASAGATNSGTGSTAAAPPTSTSALIGITPVVGLTPLPTQADASQGVPPPLDIQLPSNWKASHYILPVRYQLIQAAMNVTAYRGPIGKGTGTIFVLWGFPSLGPPPTLSGPGALTAIPGTPAPDLQAQMLWSDGMRLLQGTLLDAACNVGNFGQKDFTVGGQHAVGEYFAVSQCPEGEPDAAGWFAGLNQNGGNFLFYVTVEPPEAYNDVRNAMQKVLDTVAFRKPGATAAATSAATPTLSGPPPTNTVGAKK